MLLEPLILALQILNNTTERDVGLASKAVQLERGRAVEGTALASLAGGTLDKIDMVHECTESLATVERLNKELAVVCKQVSDQAALQPELCDAQDSSSRFEARWRPVRENVKTTEHHIAQAAQQLPVAQAKMVHESSRSRAF